MSLGLYCLWSCLIALIGHVTSQNVTMNGASGEPCGPEDVKCLSYATCNNGTCVCPSARLPNGDGRTMCYRNNEYWIGAYNDPVVRTYDNDLIDLPIPCRYRFTHIKTQLKSSRQVVIGTCEFIVSLFHGKDKGKFFVGGFDVAWKLRYNDGRIIKASVRKTGVATSAEYTYNLQGISNKFRKDGPWGQDISSYIDRPNGVKILCKRDRINNLVRLTARQCGVRVSFRSYDIVLRRFQKQIPGVGVRVLRDFAPIEFFSGKRVIALIPAAAPNSVTINDIMLPGLGPSESLIYRALTSRVKQNQPHPNQACRAANNILKKCDKQEVKTAFNNCLWILKSPRFIRCFDPHPDGVAIMSLFNSCIGVFCKNEDCAAVIQKIKASECDKVKGYQSLKDFVDGNLC